MTAEARDVIERMCAAYGPAAHAPSLKAAARVLLEDQVEIMEDMEESQLEGDLRGLIWSFRAYARSIGIDLSEPEPDQNPDTPGHEQPEGQ